MNGYLWLELLLRSSVLLVAGELILLCLRRAPAFLRHRFLYGMLLLLAILPVLVMLTPEVNLPFSHHHAQAKALVTATGISQTVVSRPPHGRKTDWLFLSWLTGVTLSAFPFLLGTLSIARIRRRARAFHEPDLLLSDEISVPLTCGLMRPYILLPASATTWTADTLNAVLLHERAHIQRRDLVTQAVAQLVVCLWWFQPLAWLLRWQLKAESEFACDAEALLCGLRPTDYASELVRIARSAATARRIPAPAIGMLHPNQLERRIRSLLYPARTFVSPTRIGSVGLALLLAAFAASALTVSQTHPASTAGSYLQGGSVMKRALLSALLTSAGLSAATITATVHDANGTAVPDAAVTLTNADSATQLQTTTSAEGKFSLAGSGAGDYILHITKNGYSSVYVALSLNAQSEINSDFIMPTEGSPAPDDTSASKAVRVGGMVAQTNLVHKVNPVYPPAAKQSRLQGTVQIRAIISKDGVPEELRVLSSPGDELSASALQAVRQWRYRPTLLNGNPVEISTTIIVNYTLAS